MVTVAVPRQRVFISSTIHDFRDIRSALRHWLESAGYDVQLSDHNDFDRKPEAHTFESCFANIGTCDHYILLIGSRRGSWYQRKDRLTVTRQEFRVARQRAAQGLLNTFVFVRDEVRTALRQWDSDGRPARKSRLLADPEFTSEFLEELEDSTERSGAQWVYTFNDFRDIIDALRPTLRLDTDLQRRLLRENLLSELLYNLTLLVHKTKNGTAFPHHWWMSARKDIVIKPDQLRDKIWLTSEQLGKSIGHIGLFGGKGVFLKRSALLEGIRSGLFLKIDVRTGQFEETEAHRALMLLDDDIDYLARNADSDIQRQINQRFMSLGYQANRGQLGAGAKVDAGELVLILRLHDVFDDVFNGLAKLAQWLMRIVPTPATQRHPISPIEGMSEKVQAERFSPNELTALLEKQVYPFGPYYTEALAQLLRSRDSVPWLRSILPPEASMSLTDDQIRAIAEEAIAHFTVSPQNELS